MPSKKYEAAEKKRTGVCNCAQAVVCAYCKRAGISEDMAMNLGNSFAAGMGNTEGTCGALVGAGIVLGLINKDRAEAIKNMRQIMNNFHKRNGATQCKFLKGTESGITLRECPDCVADACEFLEEIIGED